MKDDAEVAKDVHVCIYVCIYVCMYVYILFPPQLFSLTACLTPILTSCVCGESEFNSGYKGLWVQCSQALCGVWMHANCLGYKTAKEVPKRILCKNCSKTSRHRLVIKDDDDVLKSTENVLNDLVRDGKTAEAIQYLHTHG